MSRATRPPTVPATDFRSGTNVRWPAVRSLKQGGGRVDSLPVHKGFGDRTRRRTLSERGFTLIEVMISALLVTLIAGAVAGALIGNTDFSADQHRRSEAQDLAQQDQERLKGLSAEERQRVWRAILADTPTEERLEGLSVEDRLKGLSAEELERLRQLLQQQAKANGSSPPSSE